MSDPQPIHAGQVLRGIRAADHNGFYETWRKLNQLHIPPSPDGKANTPSRLVFSVFNDSGAAITADFPVLKITGPYATPDDRENVIWEPVAFNGDTPDADTSPEDIVIVQGPIGEVGRRHGVKVGPSYVDIEWTDETHEFAAVKPDDNTKLTSAASGIKVIWHQDIPDAEYLPATLRALVLLGGGGSNRLTAALWVVTTEISAATGDTDEITPGTGEAIQYEFDSVTGVATPIDMEPIEILNYDPAQTYAVNVGIYVSDVPGTALTMVLSAHCSPYDEPS